MSTAAIIPMKWAENTKYAGSMDHCACCGRPLRGAFRWVEVINGGADVGTPCMRWDETDAGYMGMYPVGPTCAKKHFPQFTHRTTDKGVRL